MKHDGVSLRHAVLMLKEQNPQLYGVRQRTGQGGPLSKSTIPKLESPLDADADDQTLFKQVLGYHQERLWRNSAALDYMQFRGICSEEAIKTFEIGFADRTLGLRLPHKNRREGAQIRERLQRLGLYRESGHEHFNGCLLFPIYDRNGSVKQIYGRKIGRQKNKVFHLYLPGPKRGIWNPECLTSPEIILTESVIDALTFWVNGFQNVTCIYGTDGFTDEHLQTFKEKRTQRIYLAYDRDQDGNQAAERDAKRLSGIGIECFRILFPPGQDANEYAGKMPSAKNSLAAAVKAAQWLGLKSPTSKQDDHSQNGQTTTLPPVTKNLWELREAGDDIFLEIGDRQYRIRGLTRNTSFEVLKVNLRIWYNERYYLDVLDLYRSRERGNFISAAAAETQLSVELIKRDLGRVLLALEELQEKRIREAMAPQKREIDISDTEKKAALNLLNSPALGERAICWVERYLEDVRPSLVGDVEDGTLFLTNLGEAFSPNRLTQMVRGYVNAADLGKTGFCHLFRHACATLMLENGADIRFIQAMLGHAKLETTEIYTHVSIRQLKAIHESTHPARMHSEAARELRAEFEEMENEEDLAAQQELS